MNKVIISNVNEVYVKVICEAGIAHEIRDHFTFFVPGYKFNPKYRAKQWEGKIRLFDMRTNRIYRGLVPALIQFCEKMKYEYEYENEKYDEELSLKEAEEFISSLEIPSIEARDYQIEYFIHCVRSRRALLLSPTASGKSLVIYLLSQYYSDKKVLVIVPNISLVTQLYKDFEDYGFNSEDNVHKIFGGEDKNSKKRIYISTWQSIYKMEDEYFDQFEVVIGDEAHLYTAKEISSIMTKTVNAKIRIGLTGTLDGMKCNKLVLEGLFGQVRKIITTKELMDRKMVAEIEIKCILLGYSDTIRQAAKKFSYEDEIKFIILNQARNRFISNLAISLKGNTLVLYKYVDKHGQILKDLIDENINDSTRRVFFVSGDTKSDERESIRTIVEKEKNAIIVASYGVYSTGVNIKNLHNVIFASPTKSRIRNLQSIGRGLRMSEDKTSMTLFDIADDLCTKKTKNYTYEHFRSRLEIYSSEKFKFKIYKVELKGT